MPIIIGLTVIIIVFLYFGNTRRKNAGNSREEFWKLERESQFVPRKDISGLDYLTIDYAALPFHFFKPGTNGPLPLAKEGTSSGGKNAANAGITELSSEDSELSMTMDAVEAMMGVVPAPAPSPLDYQKAHMAPLAQELSETERDICAMAQSKILNLTGISNTELRLTYGTANLDPLSVCDQNFTALIRLLQKWGNLLISSDCKDDAVRVLAYAVSIGSDIAGTYAQLSRLYKERGEYSKIEELRETAEQLTTLMKPSILRDLDVLLAEPRV